MYLVSLFTVFTETVRQFRATVSVSPISLACSTDIAIIVCNGITGNGQMVANRQRWHVICPFDNDSQKVFPDGQVFIGHDGFELEGEFFTGSHAVDQLVGRFVSTEFKSVVTGFGINSEYAVIGSDRLDAIGIGRRRANHFDCHRNRFACRCIDNRIFVTGIKRRFERIDSCVFDIEMVDRIGQLRIIVRIGHVSGQIALDLRTAVLFIDETVIFMVFLQRFVTVENAVFFQLDILPPFVESRRIVCPFDIDVNRMRERSVMAVGNLYPEFIMNRIALIQ